MDDSDTHPILKVPLEILLRITSHLLTPDLGRLRLTSQHFYRSLDPTFIKEFFTKKQFMITDGSLQALIDISNSRLGPCLRFLQIGLDRFPENAARGSADQARGARAYQLSGNQFTLLSTGHHRDMLVEAFRNLKNLEDVVIRDFNSAKRLRDGPNARWNSYGVTTLFEETGVRLLQGSMGGTWHSDLSSQYAGQIFAAVIDALGKAEARPKGIEVMSRHGNPVRGFAFNIPTYAEPSIFPVLNNLEKLHLDIDLSWCFATVGAFDPSSTSSRPDLADPMICKFLLNCTSLKKLRINERGNGQQGIAFLLAWMGHDSNAPSTSPAPPSAMPNQANAASQAVAVVPILSPTFSHLEELNLGSMIVEAGFILKIVRKFAKSLKRLELWRVTLTRRPITHTSGGPPKINFWAKFLAKLQDIPNLELHHVKFGQCTQSWYNRSPRVPVVFADRKSTIEYTGPDWKHFVEAAIPKIEVQWPEQHSDESPDEDDEDDGLWDLYALDL